MPRQPDDLLMGIQHADGFQEQGFGFLIMQQRVQIGGQPRAAHDSVNRQRIEAACGQLLPQGFGGVQDLTQVAEIMARHNYTDELIHKLYWKNFYDFALRNL